MTNLDEVVWPRADYSRVPYMVFADQDVFDREMERVSHGPVWCYIGLEAEIANSGDYITTFLGNTQIVVTRDEQGRVHSFVNRCAHRRTTLVRDLSGNAEDFTCIYHHWCYDLNGNLIGVPFERGMNGQGGMPDSFVKVNHGLRKLPIAIRSGVIFSSFHPDPEPFEDYAGPRSLEFLDMMFGRPIEILGYMRQRMPSNWKLYWENINDNYHAGLLHQFQATFGLYRNTLEGGTLMDDEARHSLLWGIFESDDDERIEEGYGDIGVYNPDLKLEDESVVEFVDEAGDNRAVNFLSIFPSVYFQRISNTLATRQIRPKGPDEFELYWTTFGYKDDDARMRHLRLKQNNMIGPGGLISMEDGESGLLGQRILNSYRDGYSVIEMGDLGPIEDQHHVLTEVPIRGFWRYYAKLMGWQPQDA